MAKKKHGKVTGVSPVMKHFKRNVKIIHKASDNLNKKSTRQEFALVYFASRGLYKDVYTHGEEAIFDARECSEIINELQSIRKSIVNKAEKYDIRL